MSDKISTSVSDGEIQAIVARIERLEEEKSNVMDDIKEVYKEAKGSGFDTKILRQIISRRKKDRDELLNEESMIDLYESALNK